MVTSADGSGCLLEVGIGVGLGLGVGTIVDVGEKEAVGVGDEELAFEFPCPPPQADNNNVADKMAALAFFMKKSPLLGCANSSYFTTFIRKNLHCFPVHNLHG